MKSKKALSLMLAAVLVLSLAVPAFAEETVTFEVEVYAPTIEVEVSTEETVSVILNPYELEYDASEYGGEADSTDQVICATQYIKNLSDFDVDLEVSAEVTVSGIQLVEEVNEGTDKEVMLELYGKLTDDPEDTPSSVGTLKDGTNEAVDNDTLDATSADDARIYYVFKLGGEANSDKSVEWDEDGDSITVVLTFTFTISDS